MAESVMSTFTIFQSPLDYPGKFVVREFRIHAGQTEPVPATEPLAVVDTLDEARASIPEGMYPMARAAEDHVSVVETWI